MQKTSSLYQKETGKQIAAQGYLRIRFGLTDTDAASTCTPETSAQAHFARPASMFAEDAPKSVYATFEPGRMRLDGRQRIAPGSTALDGAADVDSVRAEGFVSAGLSGADGSFAAADAPRLAPHSPAGSAGVRSDCPRLVLRFTKTHSVPGLTFTFDAVCEDWPAELRLTAYGPDWRTGGEILLLDKTYEPDAAEWTMPDAIDRFDRLEVRFVRTSRPFRRVRLQQLMFGYGLVFDHHSITQATRRAEVDPIGRRLPANTFDFTIVNINSLTGTDGKDQYLYDPDNAQGIYRYISEQNPLRVEYGQRLPDGMTWGDAAASDWGSLELSGWREVYEGGVTEWVPGGRYYLTGQPTVDGLTASFKAQDGLSGLTSMYWKGVYAPAGRSLYALALDVLNDSSLPRFDANAQPWTLWEGLTDFVTTAPLPAKPYRELLQLIAHAACCVLYTDREGYLHIEPACDVQDDFLVGMNSMYARPKVSQIPTLLAVECPAYVYLPEDKVSELHKEDVLVDGTVQLTLTFAQAADVAVSVAGAQVEAQTLYAGAAELALSGRGTAHIVVTGRKLAQSKRMVTAAVESPDENGSVETLDDPLITDVAHALLVAEWTRDWLLLRNTYECEYRGSPELDPDDLIRMEHQFSPDPVPVRVLKSELTYTGALRGKLAVKRMESDEQE